MAHTRDAESRPVMTTRRLNTKLTDALRGPLSWEFGIMLGLATLLLVANVAHLAYTIGLGHGLSSANDTFTISGGSNFLIPLRVGITFGLLVCAAGLALRKSSGVFASMVGITWVFLAYAWWRHETLTLLRSAEVDDYSPLSDIPLAAGLWGATWWDLFVPAAAAILFIWQGDRSN